uniref:Putative secreted protein n=1 Tax=Anopheles marajoara TaxID=58244 RepID=A0A2M4CDX1_9DIPT
MTQCRTRRARGMEHLRWLIGHLVLCIRLQAARVHSDGATKVKWGALKSLHLARKPLRRWLPSLSLASGSVVSS